MRLDNADWRNCTFTLLLASEVLGDSRCTRAVERSNVLLLRMRIGDVSSVGRPLWGTAYGLDAFASNRLADYPPGIDMLASRHAMQTLIATVLILGDPQRQPVEEQPPTPTSALLDATTAIAKLPKYDEQWIRIYDYDPATSQPPPLKPVGLEKVAPPPPPRYIRGHWGLDVALADTEILKTEGRAALGKRLSSGATMHERLAATVCGLDDEPFSLTSEAEEMRQGPEVEDKTSQRTRRLWRQLLRARLERQH
jgi:hypothetical protein